MACWIIWFESARFAGEDGVAILRIQAGLFLESYLRRRDASNSKTAAV